MRTAQDARRDERELSGRERARERASGRESERESERARERETGDGTVERGSCKAGAAGLQPLAVSQYEVPKCMIDRSADPSATLSILAPAPPMTSCEPPEASAVDVAATRMRLEESPVVTTGRAASAAVGFSEERLPKVPVPAPTRPYTTAASALEGSSAPLGNGRPMAPATARPRTEIPTSDWTLERRPSTNSRVPSSGSTNMVIAVSGTASADAASGQRLRRSSGSSLALEAARGSSDSSSSPMIFKPGHSFFRASTMAF